MRHRSRRPVLDRLLPDTAPGMTRRGVLLVAAVLGALALGVAVAGPIVEPAPGESTVAVDSPVSSSSASWSIATVPGDRETRPSRGGDRDTPPPPPVEEEPTPEAPAPTTQGSSPTPEDSPSPTRTPSPTATQTQTQQSSPSAQDSTAPNTSASTTGVDDGAWTVTASSSESGSSFECALDGGGYEACGPTTTFDDLDNGKHTLSVRAVDDAGNVDPSPAVLTTTLTGNLDD